MKFFSLFLLFSYLSICHGQKLNKIDSLTTAKQVEDFIRDDSNKINYYYLKVDEKINYDLYCKAIADSLKLQKNWGKADFDNNGLTDLLVTGNTSDGPQTIYILDKGGHFESKNLSRGKLYEQCSFSTIKDNKIEYQSIKYNSRYVSGKLVTENLVYKNGGFIEETRFPKRHHILEIKLEKKGSYKMNSYDKIEIVSNRDVTWSFNDNDKFGASTSKLSQEKFNQIVNLLNYLDFENLADEYNAGYSDAATTYIKITYDNLKEKNIHDYGGMGSRGLKSLYDMIFDLIENQKWTKYRNNKK